MLPDMPMVVKPSNWFINTNVSNQVTGGGYLVNKELQVFGFFKPTRMLDSKIE